MISIGQYTHAKTRKSWHGWIEDKDWILFLAADGTASFFSGRDHITGAVK